MYRFYVNKQTAFRLHVYPKDRSNNKLKILNETRLKQYLLSANPESACTVSPAVVLTMVWQPSWNSQWSSLVGNLKFHCQKM